MWQSIKAWIKKKLTPEPDVIYIEKPSDCDLEAAQIAALKVLAERADVALLVPC